MTRATSTGTSLELRALTAEDEREAIAAHEEMLEEGFRFLLHLDKHDSFSDYLRRLDAQQRGEELEEWAVPATLLVADVDGRIVGRTHTRHRLNETLRVEGGHIGFGVRPAFRRRGYGTEILRRSLTYLADLGVDRALVTCADDNHASRHLIEQFSGRPHDVIPREEGGRTRRYWIRTST